METPALDADFVAAYFNELPFTAVIIRKDHVVIRAFFYQTAPEDTMPLGEWACTLADCIHVN